MQYLGDTILSTPGTLATTFVVGVDISLIEKRDRLSIRGVRSYSASNPSDQI